MPGADMLVGWVDDESGEVVVQDRWAHGKATPSLDDCPSWLSDGGFQNDTHTVVAASRRRDTGDPSDRKIVNGPMKVIWAHNEDGTDGFGYHGSMRHATSIEFFSDPVLDEFYKKRFMLARVLTLPNPTTSTSCALNQSWTLTLHLWCIISYCISASYLAFGRISKRPINALRPLRPQTPVACPLSSDGV